MRWLLNCLYLDVLFCALPYWLWKIPQARRYRAGVPERLGFSPRMDDGRRRLWIHCSSVGEASIPRKLVEEFRESYPDWDVVFSTFTDTGAERLRKLYPDCTVFYWPLDLSFCVENCLNRVEPSAVVLVELEVWPNFMDACARMGIPVSIINGRISDRSAHALRCLSRLVPRLWKPVELCCARSGVDARRFAATGIGEERVFNLGSLKYDALHMQADSDKVKALQRQFRLAPDAPVLVAGSTHPGEEDIICQVYVELKREFSDLRLIIVPRHIERAEKVAARIGSFNLPFSRKTELDADRTSVTGDEAILVDTIGDLVACYDLATCVFVGRSLKPPGGGQNMMEPAALGKPVLVGPHTGNFKPEMALLKQEDAVLQVQDAEELWRQLHRLLSDRQFARAQGGRARAAVLRSQGATMRTFRKLQRMLEGKGLCADSARSAGCSGC